MIVSSFRDSNHWGIDCLLILVQLHVVDYFSFKIRVHTCQVSALAQTDEIGLFQALPYIWV